MSETPGPRCRRPLGCYRCAVGVTRCYRRPVTLTGVRPSLYVGQEGRLLQVLPVTVTHTPICSGQNARGLRGGAQAFSTLIGAGDSARARPRN
jgi:hypothetical protein